MGEVQRVGGLGRDVQKVVMFLYNSGSLLDISIFNARIRSIPRKNKEYLVGTI